MNKRICLALTSCAATTTCLVAGLFKDYDPILSISLLVGAIGFTIITLIQIFGKE